jgi:hypothetical protein
MTYADLIDNNINPTNIFNAFLGVVPTLTSEAKNKVEAFIAEEFLLNPKFLIELNNEIQAQKNYMQTMQQHNTNTTSNPLSLVQ